MRDHLSNKYMKADEVGKADDHEILVRELADRLVRMGWLTPDSEGLRQMIEDLRNGSDDQLAGFIAACDRRIADPPCCG
jgi:hypothetical protein